MHIIQHYAAVVAIAVALSAVGGCDSTAGSQSRTPASAGQGTIAHPDATTQTGSNRPRTLDKTFDDIKFDIEKDEPFERSMLTEGVKELFGKHIRIRGYMYPTYRSKGIDRFVLVRDNQECCFGPGAALYDCVRVTLQEGHEIEYSHTPIAVEGQFNLDEFRDPEGTVRAVFHIEGAEVK